MASPSFDHDLGLRERVEDLNVEQLVPELAVEALCIAVLPGADLLDENGLGTNRGERRLLPSL